MIRTSGTTGWRRDEGGGTKRSLAQRVIPRISGVIVVLLMLILAGCAQPSRILRVCADPNNMPFSNARGEGFENALAELVARELNARVEYTWWAQRRGFIRSTLGEHACDVVMGLPSSVELALTTRPYYRSTYVFITRRGANHTIQSFDDSLLRVLRVGVQMIGDDYANAPPAHALAQRMVIASSSAWPNAVGPNRVC